MAGNTAVAYTGGATIRFPHVFASIGGGWDEGTNTFTCPITGYYLVTASLYKTFIVDSYNYECYADLYQAGSMQLRMMNFDRTSERVSYTSSAHAILPCNQGDEIWMRMGTSCSLFDQLSYNFNQFSGLLVKPGLE